MFLEIGAKQRTLDRRAYLHQYESGTIANGTLEIAK